MMTEQRPANTVPDRLASLRIRPSDMPEYEHD